MKILCSSVVLKTDLYTSKLVKPNSHLSFSRFKGVSRKKLFFGLFSSNSILFWKFVFVRSVETSVFSLIQCNKSSANIVYKTLDCMKGFIHNGK